MGRGVQIEPQIPASLIAESFTVGQAGALIRAATARGDLVGEPACYRDADHVLRVRLSYRGKRRTMNAAKIGWILAHGVYPRGQVIAIGAEDDFRRGNLTIVPHCAHRPQSAAGKASSLERRAAADAKLLATMADNPGASLAELSRLAGIGEARTSTRLSKLAERGLTASPMCVPGRAWALTGQGREIAMAERPLLDELDRDILGALAVTSMGVMKLKIIDGRNRYRACKIAGAEPILRRIEFPGGEAEALAYVVSRNLKRRHLTLPQRSVIAAKVAGLKRGRPEKIGPGTDLKTQEQAAKMLDVSVASVGRAKTVIERKPELLDAVRAGEMGLREAADAARHQPEPEPPEALVARVSAKAKAHTAKVAKSSDRYMEHLHDAFRASGQTRAELIDRWWEGLTEEGRQRFYDDKIAPWLEARRSPSHRA